MHAYNQSSVILFYNDIIFFSITLTYISFTNKLRILLWSVHTSIINTSTDSKPFCVPLWVWKFPMISYGHSMYKRPTRVIKKKSIRCIIPPLSIFFFEIVSVHFVCVPHITLHHTNAVYEGYKF